MTRYDTDDLLTAAETNCQLIARIAMEQDRDSELTHDVVPRDGLQERTKLSFLGLKKPGTNDGLREASRMDDEERLELLQKQNQKNLAKLARLDY